MPSLKFSKDALRRIRTERGLSRHELADAVQCHHSTVKRWEHGLRSPNAQAAVVTASALGCSVRDLFEAVAE
ncbi:helix-turn-helix transcriptional regulator [Streptomyces sp. NPDC093084]|uniref:helix-turn-helix transcriptional regulator n=1 Tax=Streptomyces sp. NPDC093084 TaxID=3155197 RepID=UPI00342FFB9C